MWKGLGARLYTVLCYVFSYCRYSKAEDLVPASEEMLEFDFLLISAGDHHYYKESHDLVGRAEGFVRLEKYSPIQFPLLRIVIDDKILILAKKGSKCTKN